MTSALKKLEALRSLQLNRMISLHQLAKLCEQDETKRSIFQTRILDISDIKDTYVIHQTQIIETQAQSPEKLDEEVKAYQAFENLYYEIQEIGTKLFECKGDPQTNISQTSASADSDRFIASLMPKLRLVEFNGDITKFSTFIDMYNSSVHNNPAIPTHAKFNLLLSYLKGSPLNVVKHLPITDANYQIAYDTLHKRYDNPRLTAQTYWRNIISFPPLKSDDPELLRTLLDVFSENLEALKRLNFKTQHWCFPLANILLDKLPDVLLSRFELANQEANVMPTYERIYDFLETQCHSLYSLHSRNKFGGSKSSYSPKNVQSVNTKTFLGTQPPRGGNRAIETCAYCKGSHSIYLCNAFKNKTAHERYEIAKNQKLCLNCLSNKHDTSNCQSSNFCRHCPGNKRHHTLIHFVRIKNANNGQQPSQSQDQSSSTSYDCRGSNINPSNTLPSLVQNSTQNFTQCGFTSAQSQVLLSTILVNIQDVRGNFQSVKAVLDCGSQTTFCSQKLAQRLGFAIRPTETIIQGVGGKNLSSNLGSIFIKICNIYQPDIFVTTQAIILQKVCPELPAEKIDIENWNYIDNLQLADPTFFKPSQVHLLIGMDLFPQIIKGEKIISSNPGHPIALNTIFGHIIMGPMHSHMKTPKSVNSFFCHTENQLLNLISKFWDVDSVPQKNLISPEDEICENNFMKTVSRNENGVYTVSLPFRNDIHRTPLFPNIKHVALSRFLSLEKRLLKNPELYSEYSKFMQEYLDLGHMELVTTNDQDFDSYYIPHFAVVKDDAVTTKLRVVFNASVPDPASHLSLNDILLPGPKLQEDIVQILLNFRIHPVALICDIQKMYRGIMVAPEHQKYQKIFWRFNPSEEVSVYKLRTVTYGINCSPYLALRTLQHLAESEGKNFPLAAQVILRETYVDDVTTSCKSIDEAIELQKQLTHLMSKAGFHLHKWGSNKSEVLSHLDPSLVNPHIYALDSDDVAKVLGLCWHPSSDELRFKIINVSEKCTKRNLLSLLARCYDPHGYLTPITFTLKYLIQQIWILGLEWDQTPTPEIIRQWDLYRMEFQYLREFKLSRHIDLSEADSIDLCGFCDGSQKGYSCVIYLRVLKSSKYYISFVIAKSRIAPLKRVLTIPRIELLAASLLSNVLKYTYGCLEKRIRINKIYAFSDAHIVLHWIKSHPSKWKPFIANRIALIQDNIYSENWHYVPSLLNPADVASRGCSPNELLNHSLWWAGPPFLMKSCDKWPTMSDNSANSEILENEKRKHVTLIATDSSNNLLDNLLENKSDFYQIQYILAYVLRFITNCKLRKDDRKVSNIDSSDLWIALKCLTRHEQQKYFSEIISQAQSNTKCPKHIRKLNVFLDSEGLLRVGGRIQQASISYNKKHPILMSRDSLLAVRYVEYLHKKYLHVGVQTLQYLVTDTFWILAGKKLIKTVVSRCVRCFKVKPRNYQPLMGSLPSYRVIPQKPFAFSGVDFSGAVSLTLSKHRGVKSQKGYICLFVCLVTKAIHLELVSDLTADAFLAALRRFVARRGYVKELFSDNGTNFVKSSKELVNLAKKACRQEAIAWNFIPPSAPHFGGVWESGIKSVKNHLVRTIGAQILTYEELNTVLCQVEAILNSRPLTPLSSDPNDIQALTPGHFLTHGPLVSLPDEDHSDKPLNRLTRWNLVQRLQRDFWRRWTQEYLKTLQIRQKWLKSELAPTIGTLVLIQDDTCPPLEWRLGRITELFQGPDGQVRVATVRTTHGDFKRPLVKLYPLPLENDSHFGGPE